MKTKKLFVLLLTLTLCLALTPAVMAADTEKPTMSADAAPAEPAADSQKTGQTENLVRTQHSINIGGKTLDYTATTGKIPVTLDGNKCEIFFTAYTKNGVEDISKRPITFAFNGGPGSSSEWLHMGVLGPRRVQVDKDGNPTELPVKLIDNEYTLLALTDMVFIDPVGTGYSTAAEGTNPNFFYTYSSDIASVGEFVRLYVARNGRWGSPKYLAGESYGTVRAVGLAAYLSDAYSMGVNGIMLISTINDYGLSMETDSDGDTPYVLMLPTYAAVGKYHGRLQEPWQSMELKAFLDEVKAFAAGEYQTALFKGRRLTEAERDAMAEKLAAYTGLTKEVILENNLRVYLFDFCMKLLADRKLAVGRFDGRYTGPQNGKEFNDPSDTSLDSAFGAAINQYLGTELGWHTDQTYVTLNDEVNMLWNFGQNNNSVDQKTLIRKIMSENKFLKVWVICGYYDLATPFSAAEWVYNHVFLNDDISKNLQFSYYESGHMFYMHLPSLVRFQQEAAAWYQGN